jgi:hypothetical protein
MPEGIIRDPKQNQETEADFGILWDINNGQYCLYAKGPFQSNNPKRYWTAGTEVNFSGPVRDLGTPYPWNNLHWNETVTKWVRVNPVPDGSTGRVIADINGKINADTTIPFPPVKEYLDDYVNEPAVQDQQLRDDTDKYRKP